MQSFEPASANDAETEYRTIESTLLETARGRWFLAEHSRRSRRLETGELEDALSRLKASLRDPPALLGRLEVELTAVETMLAEARGAVLARSRPSSGGAAAGEQRPVAVPPLRIHRGPLALRTREVSRGRS